MLHISHGTLGMVYALAAVGEATGRAELVDLALAGAADTVSLDEAGTAAVHQHQGRRRPRVRGHVAGPSDNVTSDSRQRRRFTPGS
jgi:hypothetical protein